MSNFNIKDFLKWFLFFGIGAIIPKILFPEFNSTIYQVIITLVIYIVMIFLLKIIKNLVCKL